VCCLARCDTALCVLPLLQYIYLFAIERSLYFVVHTQSVLLSMSNRCSGFFFVQHVATIYVCIYLFDLSVCLSSCLSGCLSVALSSRAPTYLCYHAFLLLIPAWPPVDPASAVILRSFISQSV
jgi:hypothetical protein